MGFLPFWDPGARFFLFRGRCFSEPARCLRACGPTCETVFSRRLSGSAQDSQPLVNQSEERLQRISRTEFDMDSPDAGLQSSRNFKEPQTDLADGGSFQFGTL